MSLLSSPTQTMSSSHTSSPHSWDCNPPDPHHVVCDHPDLQPLLAETADKRNVQEFSCLQNINHILVQVRASSRDCIQSKIRAREWKTGVGLGFVTFVDQILAKITFLSLFKNPVLRVTFLSRVLFLFESFCQVRLSEKKEIFHKYNKKKNPRKLILVWFAVSCSLSSCA